MLTSYHVHTRFSDGRDTVRDYVRAAGDMGLDELGISDHFVLVDRGPAPEWSMDLAALPAYVDEVRAAAGLTKGKLVVRLGLEADFIPETASQLGELLRAHPFDYVIGGIHILDGFMVDECRENWLRLSEPERNDMARAYWDRMRALAESRLFDIVAHIDVYKKFDILPTVDLSADIETALDAIAESDMAVELNTSGWYWEIAEAYPSPAIIRECRKRGIPMLISSDAHHTSHLTRSFERAGELLAHAGYTQKAIFAGRKRRLVAL